MTKKGQPKHFSIGLAIEDEAFGCQKLPEGGGIGNNPVVDHQKLVFRRRTLGGRMPRGLLPPIKPSFGTNKLTKKYMFVLGRPPLDAPYIHPEKPPPLLPTIHSRRWTAWHHRTSVDPPKKIQSFDIYILHFFEGKAMSERQITSYSPI